MPSGGDDHVLLAWMTFRAHGCYAIETRTLVTAESEFSMPSRNHFPPLFFSLSLCVRVHIR